MKRVDLRIMIALIVFILLPFLLPDYFSHVFILTLFFAYLAHSWSILSDAGQVSMGHSVFSGIGAYVSLLLFIRLGMTPWIGMWIAAAIATGVGLFIGYLSFRYGIRELYFILVTLAFSQIFVFLAINLPFVGGPNGLSVPVKPSFMNYQFTQKYVYYYVIFFLFVASMVIRYVIQNRKLGHYFAAIRENVCSVCIEQRLDGTCPQRESMSCALDAYIGPIIESIEEAAGISLSPGARLA